MGIAPIATRSILTLVSGSTAHRARVVARVVCRALTMKKEHMRVSAASIDISPDRTVVLGAAMGADKTEWLGVTERIEANFVALWTEGHQPLLIVSLDLLYPGRIVRSAIEAAAVGIPADRIFVAATHTHRAPMTDDTKPKLGVPDEAYMMWLTERLTHGVSTVLDPKRTIEATLLVGSGVAEHSINRRLRKRLVVGRRIRVNEVVNAPNERGETDETVLALALQDQSGKLIAMIWNYACHPVAYPRLNTVAAHFPGVLRKSLRDREANPSLPVLFLQGYSGDTKPSASAQAHSRLRRLRQLVSGRLFEDMTVASYTKWSRSLAEVALATLDSASPIGSPLVTTQRESYEGTGFATPLEEPVTFHGVHIGPVSLVGVSGEAVSGYASRVRNLAPNQTVFCVGCIDHPLGYIPTMQVLEDGGYEGGGFCSAFSLAGLNPDIERNVMRGFVEVLSKVNDRP